MVCLIGYIVINVHSKVRDLYIIKAQVVQLWLVVSSYDSVI